MWTNSLLIAVLGVGLLVVLAIVLAMGIEIIRQIAAVSGGCGAVGNCGSSGFRGGSFCSDRAACVCCGRGASIGSGQHGGYK